MIDSHHIVIGTAGHIDHGKSLLTKALTGIDPDRLKEEKERGMTTDLGFAFYGDNATIIDVPGHEKFVRHMIAGASTIDLVLLVIAADDGIMDQTIEHFEITKLLGIKRGIVVITKKDLVDEEWLEWLKNDIRSMVKGSFLENAPIVAVSSKTFEGIPELKKLLSEFINQPEPKPDRDIFRMPIDRCFTIKGFGTVVTGTILSGSVKKGDEVELLPQRKIARIRGVQVHNQNVTVAKIGTRAALNLIGIEKEEIVRGNVLAQVGYYIPTLFVNASLYLLSRAPGPLKNMTRVHLHLGTAEILARVLLLDKQELLPGEQGLIQLRLETETITDRNDRFVIRSYSPTYTIGGGIVLEPNPIKARRFDPFLLDRLTAIQQGDKRTIVEQYLLKSKYEAKTTESLAKETLLSKENLKPIVETLNTELNRVQVFRYEGKDYLVHKKFYHALKTIILEELTAFHSSNPHRLHCRKVELLTKLATSLGEPIRSKSATQILFNHLVEELTKTGLVISQEDKIRLHNHTIKLSPSDKIICDKIENIYLTSQFVTPTLKELKTLTKEFATPRELLRITQALLDMGILVNIGEGIILHQKNLQIAQDKLIQFLKQKTELTASEFRQMLQTSRKYIIPLLNYFDTKGITQRRGEIRVLRTSAGKGKDCAN